VGNESRPGSGKGGGGTKDRSNQSRGKGLTFSSAKVSGSSARPRGSKASPGYRGSRPSPAGPPLTRYPSMRPISRTCRETAPQSYTGSGRPPSSRVRPHTETGLENLPSSSQHVSWDPTPKKSAHHLTLKKLGSGEVGRQVGRQERQWDR
jgi:hypothetical protein